MLLTVALWVVLLSNLVSRSGDNTQNSYAYGSFEIFLSFEFVF